jgi:hypothetical protein
VCIGVILASVTSSGTQGFVSVENISCCVSHLHVPRHVQAPCPLFISRQSGPLSC